MDATESMSSFPDYGSTSALVSNNSERNSNNSEDDDESEFLFFQEEHRRSIHKINPSNVMLSVRPPLLIRRQSLAEQFAMVPSELKESMQLVVDEALDPDDMGALFYSEEAYYNVEVEPSYVITIHPELYSKMFDEVLQASEVPCGMYWCCHGGDRAHTGSSHEDYVDISIAWLVMGTFLSVMLYFG